MNTIYFATHSGARSTIVSNRPMFDAPVLRYLRRQASLYVFDSDLADGADLEDCVRFGLALAGLQFSKDTA